MIAVTLVSEDAIYLAWRGVRSDSRVYNASVPVTVYCLADQSLEQSGVAHRDSVQTPGGDQFPPLLNV